MGGPTNVQARKTFDSGPSVSRIRGSGHRVGTL